MDPFEYGDAFIRAFNNEGVAHSLFDAWIAELASRRRWSESNPDGRCIPWRAAGAASEHLREVLKHPGCYMFGAEPAIPRYVGATGASLRKRLFGRYLRVGGASKAANLPQLLLAEKFEPEIKAAGIAAFPDDVVQAYKRSYRGGQARLVGAVDFVEHGLDGIWFTVLPLADAGQARPLERLLIRVASDWNVSHGFRPMCQENHGFEYRIHLDGGRPGWLLPR